MLIPTARERFAQRKDGIKDRGFRCSLRANRSACAYKLYAGRLRTFLQGRYYTIHSTQNIMLYTSKNNDRLRCCLNIPYDMNQIQKSWSKVWHVQNLEKRKDNYRIIRQESLIVFTCNTLCPRQLIALTVTVDIGAGSSATASPNGSPFTTRKKVLSHN